MNFDDAIMGAGQGSIRQQVEDLGGTGRGLGTRRLAEARARVTGNKVKSEMKAIQRALKTGREPVKQSPDTRAAAARLVGAAHMRTASAINVGTVEVQVSDETPSKRNLGLLTLDPADQRKLAEAAALYESGMIAEADQAMNEAIMDAYGKSVNDGRNPRGMTITNYRNGIDFV